MSILTSIMTANPLPPATRVTQAEIASQPDLWQSVLADPEQRAAAAHALAAPGERVLAIGCGTSAFVAMAYGAIRDAAGFGETDACYASELPAGRRYDRVVAFTRSGTTTEVVDALLTLPTSTRKVAVTAVAGERVDELVDDRLTLAAADEHSVVQTRFPTTVLALARAVLRDDVSGLVADGRRALAQPLTADPSAYNHFVYLGTGWTVGLAHEAALKIREAAQAWAESYPAMDYRHGPIAVAGPRSLVVMIGAEPAGLRDAITATGATVVSSDLDPLAQLVQAQQLAVDLATTVGLDPDRPRGLTRSVVLAPAGARDHQAPNHSQTGSPR
jgi:glucosamine--fructose-6-phosphate aminotransferase (isomerizing)